MKDFLWQAVYCALRPLLGWYLDVGIAEEGFPSHVCYPSRGPPHPLTSRIIGFHTPELCG